MTTQKVDKILIIDDEMIVADMLALHLEEAGYISEWASDGMKGLEMLAEGRFSLVLLDIWMPHMSGIDVLERIRESGSDVAVIMMSGHGSENLAVNCMKRGAMDYVAKPFEMNDLLQRADQAIINRNTLREKRRLEREKDDFISMLSHDMKNPITAVIGSIDITREGRLGPINPEQAMYLQSAIDSCNEVVAMIDNLLDIHRFEAGLMRLHLQPCNPEELIAVAAAKFSPVAEREGVSVTVDVEQSLPLLSVDRSAFSRIIANLLVNALKFTPEGGTITLSAQPLATSCAETTPIPYYATPQAQQLFSSHRNLLRLSVKDTGNGIPPEDHAAIFERYVQSHPSSKEYAGAGLGLAYCKLTVKGFGGVIWVESAVDKGSEFIILLPALE